MLQELDFTGKTALVFGASRGIGLASVITLSNYGATVVLAARSIKEVNHHAQTINKSGQQAFAVACDVSDYQAVVAAVDYCLEHTGRIDIVVNNAGIIEPLSHLITSDPVLWGRAADVNYKGVYHAMRAAVPAMIKAGGGTVVNMSSGAANSALLGWSHYCSNKAAAQKLTQVAHRELAQSNIRIVGLSPGTVATDMMAKIREAKINAVSELSWDSHIPPEWAAEGVAYLCGPEGAQFAGTDFSIKTVAGRQRVGLPIEGAQG
ncbi:SDR family oxidoreductase [Alteromonadaceae bacterium BrNp21-10]|nr:SDR family oxidoreductase [Alteromonadaceae bacterium BrNp21-10]